jgi:alkylation response protein AidB-like acyl-CoA dehydrogenase
VGEENVGWRYITTQLDFERVGLSPVPELVRLFDAVVELYRRAGLADGEEWSSVRLAEIAAEVNTLRWMDWKTAALIAEGKVPVAEASLIKVIGNETKVKILGDILQMLGSPGLLRHGQEDTFVDGARRTYEMARRGSTVNLFGGGSNDVQRDIMGFHGLGLPR